MEDQVGTLPGSSKPKRTVIVDETRSPASYKPGSSAAASVAGQASKSVIKGVADGPPKRAWTTSQERAHGAPSSASSPLPGSPPRQPGEGPEEEAVGYAGLAEAEGHMHLEDLEKLHKRFEEKGTLTMEELVNAFDTIFGVKDHEDTRRLFHKIDYNCDGKIVWDEFCTFAVLEVHEREDARSRARQVNFELPAIVCQTGPHRDSLNRICNLPDGTLVSCSQDGTFCVWTKDLRPRRSRKSEVGLMGKHKWITDMAVCVPQSKIILTTGDHEVQFYEMVNFEPYCQLRKLEAVPLRIAFWHEPEDHHHCLIIIGDKEGTVVIFEIRNILDAFKYWKLGTKSSEGLPTYSIDRLVSGSIHGVKVYRWKIHSNWVSEVHYFPDLRSFVSCSCDSTASVVSGSPSGSTPVDALLPSTSGITRRISSLSLTSTAAGARHRHALPAKRRMAGDQRVFRVNKGVCSVDYCPKNKVLVTASVDQVVRIWNPFVCSKPVGVLQGHSGPVFFVQVDSTEDRIYSVGNDNTVKVWHTVDHNCLCTVIPSAHKVYPAVEAVHFNPVSQQLAMGAEQLTVLPLVVPSGIQNNIVHSHIRSVAGVAYSECFNQVVTACEGAVVKAWDLKSGACMFEFSANSGKAGLSAIDIDHSGKRIVTGTQDGQIKIWSYNNGLCIKSLDKGNSQEVTDLKFMTVKKNRYIVAVGWDRKVHVFADVGGPAQLEPQLPIDAWTRASADCHADDILSVVFGAPHFMATASFDGEIIVWSMVSYSILSRMKATRPRRASSIHISEGDKAVHKLLFLDRRSESKDAASLVASGPAGYIHFWNIYDSTEAMGCFEVLQSTSGAVNALAANRDCSVLFSADSEGYVSLWNIQNYCTCFGDTQPPLRITHWQAHNEQIISMVLIEEKNVLVTGSEDSSARLWTLDGHSIGTFGQASQWRLDVYLSSSDHGGCPQSNQQEQSTVCTGDNPPLEEKRAVAGVFSITDLDEADFPYDSGDSVEETIELKESGVKSTNPGKHLRHFRRSSATTRRVATPGVYARLPCQPLQVMPQCTRPDSLATKQHSHYNMSY